MADKVEKPKKQKAKPKKEEKGVLAALPSTRPERIGSRRPAGARAPARKAPTAPRAVKTSAAKTPTAATNGASTAKARAPRKPAAKPATATARMTDAAQATAARRKAAAPRTFEPTEAAETAAGPADERAAGAVAPRDPASTLPRPEPPRDPGSSYPRPQAVREGAPGIGTTGHREQPSPESGRPSGVELVSSAVQAAGELGKIGLTIGGHLLKRAADRLPKP